MKVILTGEALADLEHIADHIAQDNPVRARSFVAELAAKARALADLPLGFPLVPRYGHLSMRWRVPGRYAIFYRVEDEQIIVLHILHGARDHEALLFPED